jgi:membrane protein
MFLLFPILLVISIGLSFYMTAFAAKMSGYEYLGPAVRYLLDLTPYVLLSLIFIGLYIYMPNTRVKPSCAIIPGILAGVGMHVLQVVYIHSQIWVTGYNAIYGSFAALPLFMLWVQMSWTICLFGAQLTYTNQNMNRIGINLEVMDIHPLVDMTDDERSDEAASLYSDSLDSL